MNKAIFLDRDGIINEELGDYVTCFENFTILEHLAEGLKMLSEQGFIFVVVTNQGGLAKKLYDEQELEKMHQHLSLEMQKHGIVFEEIYYCPHHPEHNGKCLCRKPGSLLVEKAIARFNIDPSKSFFIGDKQRDIDAGNACGVNGVLVKANSDMREIASKIIQNL